MVHVGGLYRSRHYPRADYSGVYRYRDRNHADVPGLLLMAIKRKSQVVTAVISAGIALWFAHLDNQVGLIIAVLVSLVVATVNEWRET